MSIVKGESGLELICLFLLFVFGGWVSWKTIRLWTTLYFEFLDVENLFDGLEIFDILILVVVLWLHPKKAKDYGLLKQILK
jgi:hypothetical protein